MCLRDAQRRRRSCGTCLWAAAAAGAGAHRGRVLTLHAVLFIEAVVVAVLLQLRLLLHLATTVVVATVAMTVAAVAAVAAAQLPSAVLARAQLRVCSMTPHTR